MGTTLSKSLAVEMKKRKVYTCRIQIEVSLVQIGDSMFICLAVGERKGLKVQERANTTN